MEESTSFFFLIFVFYYYCYKSAIMHVLHSNSLMKTDSALRLLPEQTINVVQNYHTHSGDQLTRTKDKGWAESPLCTQHNQQPTNTKTTKKVVNNKHISIVVFYLRTTDQKHFQARIRKILTTDDEKCDPKRDSVTWFISIKTRTDRFKNSLLPMIIQLFNAAARFWVMRQLCQPGVCSRTMTFPM